MMIETQKYLQYLKLQTDCEWREVSPTLLDFKLEFSPFNQMCVVTPDDPCRVIRPRYFIPAGIPDLDLYQPKRFVKNYVNAKKNLVESMPAIQVDLEGSPKYPFIVRLPRVTYTGTYQLTGEITCKTVSNLNNFIISPHSITISNDIAKLSSTCSVNIDEDEGISISLETDGGDLLGTTNIEILAPNKFTAEYQPKSIYLNYRDLEIEGTLGFKIAGEINPNNPNETASSDPVLSNESDLQNLSVWTVVTLIVFSIVRNFAPGG